MIEQYQTYAEGKPDKGVRKKKDEKLKHAQFIFEVVLQEPGCWMG